LTRKVLLAGHFLMLTLEETRCRIPRSRKLNQIEAVPERIGHFSHAPVFADLYFTIKRGSEATQSLSHVVEIGHDEIDVWASNAVRHRVAPCRAKLYHSPAIGEEKGRQISACKLDPVWAVLPLVSEPKPTTIELDTAIEVSHRHVGVDYE
jgi:hypothetical protein